MPNDINHYRINTKLKFEELLDFCEELILDNNLNPHLTTIERGSVQLFVSTIKFCLERYDFNLSTAISDNKEN